MNDTNLCDDCTKWPCGAHSPLGVAGCITTECANRIPSSASEIARLRSENEELKTYRDKAHRNLERMDSENKAMQAKGEALSVFAGNCLMALSDMIDEAEDCYARDMHLIGTTERNTQVMATRRADIDKARALARQPVEKEIRQS